MSSVGYSLDESKQATDADRAQAHAASVHAVAGADQELIRRAMEDPALARQLVREGRLPAAVLTDLFERTRPERAPAEIHLATIVNNFLKGFQTVAMASVNGVDLGVYTNTPDGNHAEQNFMDHFAQGVGTWRDLGYVYEDGPNVVELLINNSPCDEKCADQLIQFKRDYPMISELCIRVANIYQGSHLHSSGMAGLEKLKAAEGEGIVVAHLDVLDETRGDLVAGTEAYLTRRGGNALDAQAQTVDLIAKRGRRDERTRDALT